ncbi:hypothetical protein TNCV_5104091 [Trichonephila clavipes]|nr:hypothetical protein TNCV_5104091 [Trichonephila clavipes]
MDFGHNVQFFIWKNDIFPKDLHPSPNQSMERLIKADKAVSWLEVTRQSGLAKLLFLFLLLFIVFHRPWTGIQPNLSKTRESEVLS